MGHTVDDKSVFYGVEYVVVLKYNYKRFHLSEIIGKKREDRKRRLTQIETLGDCLPVIRDPMIF